jgi:hypothetical protein
MTKKGIVEKPILFSTAMVQAILDGRKTITRRVLAIPDNVSLTTIEVEKKSLIKKLFFWANDTGYSFRFLGKKNLKYRIGDRLWVKETWGINGYSNESFYEIGAIFKADNQTVYGIDLDNETLWERYADQEEKFEKELKLKQYYACDVYCNKCIKTTCDTCSHNMKKNPILWRPSIFMPRRVARITLEITDVQIERVQDISEKEAELEGFDMATLNQENGITTLTYKESFKRYWDSLNEKRGYSWKSNPWVYCITFRKITA